MIFKLFSSKLPLFILALGTLSLFTACNEEDKTLASISLDYQLHNGQTVPTAPYTGIHPTNFSATLDIEELEQDGKTLVTVTLNNTVDGQAYHIHAHDAADPATTLNGTPYNETPNSGVFAQMVTGNGGTISIEQESDMSLSALTETYEGFFVIHDPLQAINTADITTYLVVGSFGRTQTATSLQSSTFEYDFNTGQVAEAFAYAGTHDASLSATISIDELADKRARVTVRIMNGMDGMVYHTHAHDMADPVTTPNGTPYIETPNADVFAGAITANAGATGIATISSKSYDEIISTYDGFFVIHDPLQGVTTTDPTTYVVLGIFAR